MRITRVYCLLLSAPYATPGDAEREIHLKTGYRPAALIVVEAEDGQYGLGETYAGVFAPEAVRELVNQLGAELVGRDAFATLALWDRIRLASYYWGRMGTTQSVLGGIEMALWDLKGKALGVPVYELLGGRQHDSLPVYASGGNPKPLDDLRTEMRAYREAGFRAVKMRINHMPFERIVESVAVCREALGPEIGLAADAAQGLAREPWSPKYAVRVAHALEPFNLLWLEEPAEVTNYAGFAEIRRGTNIPIAGGETVTSLVEAELYLRAGALDLFQPDAAMIGGIGIFRQVAQMCERQFLPVAVHAWSSAVGIMGNFHAAFATRNCTILELSGVPNPLRDELLNEPFHLVDGRLPAPGTPGLGIRLPDGLDAIEQRYPFRPGSAHRVPLD